MLDIIRDLTAHKGYANAAFLNAIWQNSSAARDAEILSLLRHVLVANRFWLRSCLGQPFVMEDDSRGLDSLDRLVLEYRSTQDEEAAWLASATETDFARELRHPLIPGGRCLVSQALMQVYLHSHGHRAQCAKLLRRLGGEPPATDLILWLAHRPAAEWPAIS